MIAARKFRTPAARKRAQVRLALRMSAFVLILVVLGVSLVYAVRAPLGRMSAVEVRTDGSLVVDDLRARVQHMLTGSFLGLIPRDSILMVSTASLADALRAQYPPIRVVDVERRGFTALQVTIEERKPQAVWCGDIVPELAPEENATATATATASIDTSWESCYLMDDTAYLYAQAQATDDHALPRFYGSLDKAEPVNQTMVSREQFTTLMHLYDLARDAGFAPRALLLTDDSDGELYLRSYRVLFARADPVDELWDRFDATVHSRVIDETHPIQYVDMRFGTKVYVKYNGPDEHEESTGMITASSSAEANSNESPVGR